mmetsp:Transcript_37160/g.80210  ORF Transcript_37160/g.80210 Transcript_37160/m.80210 type:complete len:682 (+) Transcript_37160:204-2249(+)
MNTFYIQAILTASIGGVLFGYDMGVIAGALPPLSAYFQLTPSQEEWVVSLLYFGGGVGAASGGFLCDWFGRKFSIMFTDVMFGLGAFLLYTAETVESVMVGRCVLGWAVAVSGIADVAYLHEISSVWGGGEDVCEGGGARVEEDRADSAVENGDDEERIKKQQNDTAGRGSVVSVNEACISLGFLLAYGVAYAMGDQTQNNADGDDGQASEEWRLMFAFGGFIAVFQFVGMLFMPESPVWLHGKGRTQEAISARNKIRGIANANGNRGNGLRRRGMSNPSFDTISQNQSDSIEMSPTALGSQPPSPGPENSSSSFAAEEQLRTPIRNSRVIDGFIHATIKIRSVPSQIKSQYRRIVDEILAPYKRQCAIALLLAASSQFCGHTSVLNFSAAIFTMLSRPGDETGTDVEKDLTTIELTVGIGVLKFLTTCIAILFIEKGGRRLWLLTGISCILISLTFLIISFIDYNDEDISDNVHQHYSTSRLKNGLGIVGIYGVAIGFAASFGPLTWLITSELFPSSIRGRALGFANVVVYMSAGLVSRTFLSIQKGIGLSGCFALYWIATFTALSLAWLGMPDTGGEKSPEEIERELNDMWIWGGRRHYRRCPSFLGCKRSAESPSSNNTFWPSTGSYGSNSYATGVSPDPSLDACDTGAISPTITSSPVDHSGLTPRRSYSNNAKEIT